MMRLAVQFVPLPVRAPVPPAVRLRDVPTPQLRWPLPKCELAQRRARLLPGAPQWAHSSLGAPPARAWKPQLHSPAAPARASTDRRLSGKVDADLLPAAVRNSAQDLARRLSSRSAMTPPAWPRHAGSPMRRLVSA